MLTLALALEKEEGMEDEEEGGAEEFEDENGG